MATDSPVSIEVIIPVWNGQEYILKAIQSIEQQTLLPNRIIIVDDGSTDRTVEVVREYRGSIPIELLKKPHTGLSDTRNQGIRRASADYLAFLDADDEWYPQKLELQYKKFQTSELKNLGVVYCQYDLIDARGNPTTAFYIFHIDPQVRGRVFDKILAENKIASSASGVLMKRACLEVAGLFDPQLQAAEDWDLWLRVAQTFDFDYIQTPPLVKIRRHAQNMQNDQLRMFTNRVIFYNKWMSRLPEEVAVPDVWVRMIISKILRRLPQRDFMHVYQERFSPTAKRELRDAVRRRGKWFFFSRVLAAPAMWLRRSIH